MNKSIVIGVIAALAVLVGGYFFMTQQKGTATSDTADSAIQNAWVEVTSDPVYLVAAGEKTPLKSGDSVSVGDTIETGSTGAETIHFPDASLARMDVNTTLTLSAISFNEKNNSLIVGIGLTVGRVWSKVVGLATPESSWEVKTSNTVATVRGTAFGIGYKKDGTSWVLGSQHTIAVAPLDPKTKKKIASAEVLLGESSLIQLNDTDAAIASAAIGSTTITAKITPITTEFKTNAWIKASQVADKEFDAKVDGLRTTGVDDASVREELRRLDMKSQNLLREKSKEEAPEVSPAPAPAEKQTNTTTAPPTTVSPTVEVKTDTVPSLEVKTTVTSSGSGTTLPAPTKANTTISASRTLSDLIEGNNVQFSAMVDTRDITNNVVWRMTGSIGSITPSGLFTALLGSDVSEFGQSTGYVTATLSNGDVLQSALIHVQARIPTDLGTEG